MKKLFLLAVIFLAPLLSQAEVTGPLVHINKCELVQIGANSFIVLVNGQEAYRSNRHKAVEWMNILVSTGYCAVTGVSPW